MNENSMRLLIYFSGLLVGLLLDDTYKKIQSCLQESLVQLDEGKAEFEKKLPQRAENITREMVSGKESSQNDSFADAKILCWMMTYPAGLPRKGKHVVATWWERCDIRIIISSKENKEFGAVVLPNLIEGRPFLYTKTMASFSYTWEKYKDEADWFMKVDDDTYVIMENLREFLKNKNPMDPVWYGTRFKWKVKQGYMSGGAGYILSKEAAKRYVEGIKSGKGRCSRQLGPEDLRIGQCLEQVGVRAGDDRDSQNREAFHGLAIDRHTSTEVVGRHKGFSIYYYPFCGGIKCTTRWPISFHYVSPAQMYMLEYLFYKAEVRGRCEKRYKENFSDRIS